MAREIIRRGSESVPNDYSLPNDSAWAAAGKINDMTEELYALQSDTINAGAVEYQTAPTIEGRIALADAACVSQGKSILFIPASMLPYDISLCPASAGVQRVREGGNAATWDVLAYGATGVPWPSLPNVDSTVAIQAALNTGHDVDFVGLTYQAVGLTQAQDYQLLYSSTGIAHLVKNANGVLLASTGHNVHVINLAFDGSSGPAYTGDNVTFTGNNCQLLNCSSRYAGGRAVKATGSHFEIIGTNDIYHTTDTTGTGYDIELGVSGTATLYHQLYGIYTSQATGGIKLTDVGGVAIVGGQYGKLTIAAGTLPAGTGSNNVVASRINGAISVGISNAVIDACAFSGGTITFETGTAGCSLGVSNSLQAGTVVTNNGNADNLYIRRGTAAGSVDFPGQVVVPNAKQFSTKQSSGAVGGHFLQDANNHLWVQNLVTDKISLLAATGASGICAMLVNGAYSAQFDANAVAGNTRMLLYDVDNGTLERVSVGVADSGGVGFKVLRIPN